MSDRESVIERLTPFDVYGPDLKRAGRGLVLKCPFHEEKTPSLHVYPETLSFRCFGCHKSGSAFDFIMERDGISFPEALQYLAKKAGVELTLRPSQNHRLFEINKVALNFFVNGLKRNEKAMSYLVMKRNFTAESIERFKLGYVGNTPSLVQHLKGKGFKEDEIVDAGLGVRKEGQLRNFFFNRIIFPILRYGKVLGFSGRIIDTGEPKYLNTTSTAVFQKSEILYGLDPIAVKQAGFAIVVEGQADVVIAHQYGHKNAAAPLGTAFTEKHAQTLKELTNWVMLIFDGDMAGSVAAERTVKILFENRMRGGVGLLPEGEDPDSFLRKGGEFSSIIQSNTPFSAFLATRYKGTKGMVLLKLLENGSPMETAEFVAYVGYKEDADFTREIRARELLDEILQEDPVVCAKDDIEARRHGNRLVVMTKGQFLLSQKINGGDPEQQAKQMVDRILKLKQKARNKTGK